MAFIKTRWIRYNFLDCVHDTKNSDFFRYIRTVQPCSVWKISILDVQYKKVCAKIRCFLEKSIENITSIYQLFPTLHVADGFTNFPSNIITIIDLQRSFLLFCFFDMKKENNTHRASLRLTWDRALRPSARCGGVGASGFRPVLQCGRSSSATSRLVSARPKTPLVEP